MRFASGMFTFACLIVLSTAQLPAAAEIDHYGKKVNPDAPGICLTCHTLYNRHAHPVNIDYPPARSKARYAPAVDVLAAGLSLSNNRIVCNTCHDLNNTERRNLAVPIKGSKLCSTCHVDY